MARTQPEKFTDLLGIKFRWPVDGDQLFRSVDPYTDADLNAPGHLKHFLIQEGYKRAADLLVEQSSRSRIDRDALA
jgi:hypothetical protein